MILDAKQLITDSPVKWKPKNLTCRQKCIQLEEKTLDRSKSKRRDPKMAYRPK